VGVKPYFSFSCLSGRLSKVHMPSSARAKGSNAPASKQISRVFEPVRIMETTCGPSIQLQQVRFPPTRTLAFAEYIYERVNCCRSSSKGECECANCCVCLLGACSV